MLEIGPARVGDPAQIARIAVDFGSVVFRRARHALAAGLLADLAGVITSILVSRAVFG